uniref:Uncharacterized protein n=1 Tax=Setaria viridis TaxID=4556 RepID=A0A4U6VGS7_SETVI|nr:hypothetical protein SEVIR_3G295400v2 [Setaria viridis]
MALQKQSGLGRDTQTGGVSADATYWEEDEQDTSGGDAPPRSQPSSQPTSVKPPPFLNELFKLFGHEPQDRGTLLTAGGIHDATPSVGTQGNAADLDQDPPASSAQVTTWSSTSGSYPTVWQKGASNVLTVPGGKWSVVCSSWYKMVYRRGLRFTARLFIYVLRTRSIGRRLRR